MAGRRRAPRTPGLQGTSMAGTASAAPSISSAEHPRATGSLVSCQRRKRRHLSCRGAREWSDHGWKAHGGQRRHFARCSHGHSPRSESPGRSTRRRGRDWRARETARRAQSAQRAARLGGHDAQRSEAALLFKILVVKPGFQVDNPTELHDVRASFPAVGETLQSGASARLTVDLTPSIRATSLTAFRSMD